ncbi:unnamed protein product [Caenorhabditis auriculariae]|uniref:acetylcholinesterase n=1 Tax=Caenorhabditis auriculariae TaxID=2777116 RepID=A0A8S1HAZ5_9PELO|nr:unnamed protein product [Caenorhabditis auriculariae]
MCPASALLLFLIRYIVIARNCSLQWPCGIGDRVEVLKSRQFRLGATFPPPMLVALWAATSALVYANQEFSYQNSIPVEVGTRLGVVRGSEFNHGSKRVRAFLGVPFAEPPIKENRFKKPKPKKPWNGTINANTMSPACFQGRDSYDPNFWGSEMWNANTPVSEDCLYLNIWAPADAQNLTVMVWLFGGGFYSGSPSLILYDGKELATRGNVIVVNVNYRLGPFGYLYFGNNDVPGNMGMLDQQLALYWIRDHIFSFGGNPSKVSLFGESAGAASIVAHLIAPASRGLFKTGILQSGSLDNKWSMDTPRHAKQKSLELARLVECNRTNMEEMITCLRETPAQRLIDNIWSVGLTFLEFPFVIVSRDVNFFKHLDGFKALREGDYSTDVNLMFGINHDEGNYWNIYNLPQFFDKKPVKPKINRDEFHQCVESAFAVQPELVRSAAKYVYSDPNCVDPQKKLEFYAEQVNQMVGDYFFTCDSVWLAHDYPKRGKANVYVYYFDQPSSANPWPQWTGVMHGYEIEFVFGVPLYNESAGYTKPEREISDKVIQYWTSFAKNGVPTLKNNSSSIQWMKYDGRNRTKWLRIKTGGMESIDELKKVECDLWRNAKNMEYSSYLEELRTMTSPLVTHYGTFFENPREVQDTFRGRIRRCNLSDLVLQSCADACFSLNVSIVPISSRRNDGFGFAFGCSSELLPQDATLTTTGCFKRSVILRTLPPFTVTAEYCTCDEDKCNRLTAESESSSAVHHKASEMATEFEENPISLIDSINGVPAEHYEGLAPLAKKFASKEVAGIALGVSLLYMINGDYASILCTVMTSLPAAVFTYRALMCKHTTKEGYHAILFYWTVYGILAGLDNVLSNAYGYYLGKFVLLAVVFMHAARQNPLSMSLFNNAVSPILESTQQISSIVSRYDTEGFALSENTSPSVLRSPSPTVFSDNSTYIIDHLEASFDASTAVTFAPSSLEMDSTQSVTSTKVPQDFDTASIYSRPLTPARPVFERLSSTVQTVHPGMGDIVTEPHNKMEFGIDSMERTLRVTNITTQHIMFALKTNAEEHLVASPTSGVIRSGEAVEIRVGVKGGFLYHMNRGDGVIDKLAIDYALAGHNTEFAHEVFEASNRKRHAIRVFYH